MAEKKLDGRLVAAAADDVMALIPEHITMQGRAWLLTLKSDAELDAARRKFKREVDRLIDHLLSGDFHPETQTPPVLAMLFDRIALMPRFAPAAAMQVEHPSTAEVLRFLAVELFGVWLADRERIAGSMNRTEPS